MKQQRGGTLLGFIIGAVVGLGAALAVAVYVTKVPVPFVNKVQNRSADQDVEESRKNKDWDPNAPLYGKNPAKPVVPSAEGVPVPPPALQPASTATVPGPAPAPAPAPAPEAKAAAPKTEVKPAVSADPLGDLAKARSGGSTVEPFIYFVQVGAFRNPEDAETQRAKLSLGGIEARVTEREQSGRAVFRVRVGPFDRKEDADKSKERLESNGMDTALVRVAR
jgi:cell division protein FtsN